jgi:hypothetical protein
MVEAALPWPHMNTRTFAIAAMLSVLACRPATVDPVPAELDRLSASLAKIEAGGVPDMLKDSIQANRQAIERARKATSPELRLYRLRDAYVGVETVAFVAGHKDASTSLDRFIALWKAQPARAITTPEHTPLLHASLLQSSANRAEKLYRASLPYGKADGALSGLYYLGEAHANERFAQLIASLEVRKEEAAPQAATLRNAIAASEAEMLKTFGNDPAAPAMIGTSVRLKEARELVDRGSLAGATLMLLESRVMYGRATAPKVAGVVATPANLPKDSMAELWRTSDNPVAKRDALPFYASLPAFAAQSAAAIPARQVHVTLVRWPYT